MTVRVERTFDLDAPPEDVWAFIADPTRRASAISVVDSFEQDGDVTIWHVRVPVVNRTIPVETRDVEREEGEYVKFVGKSKVLRVTGEHRIESREGGGTRLHNEFVVDGRLPGVERFFKRNLDEELDNLKERLDG
ncbi:SRPBCC family protein [Salarchaeum sp. JOR-1]|uniref:SRPBCC family protein n=1 Tax=Salarchaeum sp. JOR-1 TaxID=2599399 RepID=UPI001198A2D2|nr:SRPBCC family protein [Salarchaeum sp. JOR-1]QDX41375.1 polyketide cyclase [Salarchaeum sp. JOR-1]